MTPKKRIKIASTIEIEDLKICKTDHKTASEAVQKAAATMQKACALVKKKDQ